MEFARLGDPEGEGKAWIDQAFCLQLSGVQGAKDMIFKALRQLKTNDTRNFQAAYQSLATSEIHRNNFVEAETLLEASRCYARQLDPVTQVKTEWVGGHLAYARGQYKNACKIMGKVVDFFVTEDPGDAIIAACDLADAQIMAGYNREARLTIEKLLPMVETLKAYRLISEAIRQLVLARQTGITTDLLNRTRREMNRARLIPHEWPITR